MHSYGNVTNVTIRRLLKLVAYSPLLILLQFSTMRPNCVMHGQRTLGSLHHHPCLLRG